MRILSILILTMGLSLSALAQRQFLKCSKVQKQKLTDATEEASIKVPELITQINQRVETISKDDVETISKLKSAGTQLDCSLRRLKTMKIMCVDKLKHRGRLVPAKTSPLMGNKMKVNNIELDYSNTSKIMQIIIHEASHKCGTNDEQYYFQNRYKVNINNHANDQWQMTASTYDFWFNLGMCIPGVDCPDTTLQK